MKAFLSYSIKDNDMYLLTLLSKLLKEKGFTISQNTELDRKITDFVKSNISKSQLFIGVIISNSQYNSIVFDELKIADSYSIPSLVMIEQKAFKGIAPKENYIIFNRENPSKAIEQLQNRIEKIKSSNKGDSNALTWLLGGLALLLLLDVFSDNKK